MVIFLNCARVSVLRRSPTASLINEKELDAYVAPVVNGFVRVPIGNRSGSSSPSLTRVELESVIAEILFDDLGELCGAQQASESTTSGPLLVFQRGVSWKYISQEGSTRSLVTSQVGNDKAPKVSIHEQFLDIGEEGERSFQDILASMLHQRDDDSLRVVALCCHAQLVTAVGTETSFEAIVPVLMRGALTSLPIDHDATQGGTGGLSHRTMVRHYTLPAAERTLAGWSAAPPKALVTSVEGWLREICFKVGILPKYGA
jgi:hypothetical protein